MEIKQLVAAAAKLDAKSIETLIADLMDLRANMEPPVSDQPPTAGSNQRVALQNDPGIIARRLKDGRIRLWIQNAGIGWLAFDLSHRNGATLRDFMAANVDTTTSDLFSKEGIDAAKH
jgi:hypothetical protein